MKLALLLSLILMHATSALATKTKCGDLLGNPPLNQDDFVITQTQEDSSLQYSFSMQGKVPSVILSALRISKKNPDEFMDVISHYKREPFRHIANEERRAYWEERHDQELKELTDLTYRILKGETGMHLTQAQFDLLQFLLIQAD